MEPYFYNAALVSFDLPLFIAVLTLTKCIIAWNYWLTFLLKMTKFDVINTFDHVCTYLEIRTMRANLLI